MTEAAVSVREVSKRFRLYSERNQSVKAALLRRGRASYEEFYALRDVSLEVPAGRTFGLVGENGSGKSTLLKCLARILLPERGQVTVRGRVAALLELGSGFHPELSGRDNVYLNGSILGLTRRELDARFDDIVGFAGLDRFIDTPVKNYSSGMYVRLGFAVAINVDPEILLVDEVLAVGDEAFQRRCNEKFADLKRQGRTIVLVSHAMGAMRTMCDEVAWLDHGVVRSAGRPQQVIDGYVDSAHPDRVAAPDGGTRHGSGQGRVERVELLAAGGRPVASVRTGDAVTFRLHYRASSRIDKPVFGLALHTLDGVHVTGPNTRDGDAVPEAIEGEGHVDLQVPVLLLVPGTYDVTVSLFDYACLNPYDYRSRALRFDVETGTPREQYGVVSLGGGWRWPDDRDLL